MSRPQPRKSSLAGSTPVTPAPPAPTAASEPAAPSGRTGQEPQPSRTRTTQKKVTFYQHPEDTARLRAALINTKHLEGTRTLSQFIDRAVMAEVERLERTYNNGEPWPPLVAGQIPTGRPVGS